MDLCFVAEADLFSMVSLSSLDHGEEEQLRELESEVIQCHIIRFCSPVMQKTAYELWLKDQKKAMHLKCARFLEENAHRCEPCRSGDFVPFHHFAVDIRLNTLDLDTIRKMAKSHGFRSKLFSFLISPNYSWGKQRQDLEGVDLDHEGFKSSSGSDTTNDET